MPRRVRRRRIKFKFIFVRACTAQKYRKAGSVQIDRKADDLCASGAKFKANAIGIRFEGVAYGDTQKTPIIVLSEFIFAKVIP